MTKKTKKKQSSSRYAASTTAGGTGEHDSACEDMDDNGPMLDTEEVHEHEVILDAKGAVAQAAPEKTAKLPRKTKQHREKGLKLKPAEDGDFERPRKRH